MSVSSRVFFVGSNVEFLSEQQIHSALSHKTIKEWAYILHDKDKYTKSDEDKQRTMLSHTWFDGFAGQENYSDEEDYIAKNLSHKEGLPKTPHWHIALRTERAMEVDKIAEWFGIESNFIDLPKGKGAFMDCCEYLTHENEKQQALGKFLYPDDEVKSNFDFRIMLTMFKSRQAKYAKPLSDKDWYRNEVLNGNLRPRDMMHDNSLITAYSRDMDTLDRCRRRYLIENAPMPNTRINYYICSPQGGVGKGLASRALARSLYPDLTDDRDIFFETGGEKTTFDDYDGQPVIIWNDVRPISLLKIFGDRGHLFDSLDIHPTRKSEHIKYGRIVLTNEVNIFNSIVPYGEFLDGLAGEYRDRDGNQIRSELSAKEQAYRRFPIIIPISETDFDILINKGVLNEGTYIEYIEHERVVANFKKLHQQLQGREELLRRIEDKTMQPVVKAHNTVITNEQFGDEFEGMSDEEILAQFSDYGKVIDRTDEFEKMSFDEQAEAVESYLLAQDEEVSEQIRLTLLQTKEKLLLDYKSAENETQSFSEYVQFCEDNHIVTSGFITLCHEYGIPLFDTAALQTVTIKYDGSDRSY